MAVGERDPHTGHLTTGHEWNGIKELNTPVPRPVWLFLAATVVFSVIYWILMPAWPLGATYTEGLLGIDQQSRVDADLKNAARDRASWSAQIETMDAEAIQADASLMRIVREAGRPLFEDNCAVCHGSDARGGQGYPDLTDRTWLWGGEPETVMETIRVGINAAHGETRSSQMPAFGRNRMLDRKAIREVATYVRSLSGAVPDSGDEATAVAEGKEIFAANCAACHGEKGTGSTAMGAPDLTDEAWIYGGDRQTVFETVFSGRQGQMPQWEERLSAVDRKILALYLRDLGVGGE
ncbi:cytochrome-c oxidase, cbb3-type subunit III [Ferruginivarius sediminum]|uniref:Cbb3-type cytochrome c oxidase subunit n=1 Tax=Ferruginivarius sediminum TaxID=2661937 RepID=A0A369T9Q9_9PROT|nr:cytochrome-c oxidase, cbb3-type subunit III [Ferruginivarius sediminum]RDD62071.1 cytochrome-c oxidase, cbb3-type subunit III [Ferruginivarius sediminum]